MNVEERRAEIEELATTLSKERYFQISCKIDSYFFYLLIFEFCFGILTAIFISPRTWSGEMSAIHPHLLAAIFLGGAIISLPLFLIKFNPGRAITRYIIAASQMLFGCLLIHLMGGRIEAHFYIFGTLAFLSAYRDWKVLVPATVVIAIDHIVRGYLWPQSVYGVISGAEWRWLEHAAWVAFENVFLVVTTIEARKDLETLSFNRSKLQIHNRDIEKLVDEKTEALRLEQEKVIQASKLSSLGELATGIAHEISNPLTIIKGQSSRIKRKLESSDFSKEDLVAMVDKIDSTTERINKIVVGMRNVSRQSHSNERIETTLREIFEDVLSLSEDRLKSKGVKFIADFSRDCFDLRLNCNRIQISQVFINIIKNAIDAIEGYQEKWIEIDASLNNENIVISITDSGHGINEETEAKIFDAFYTSKDIGKGTGLGLSLSKNIIKDHQGNIYIDHQCRNTRFMIELPVFIPILEKNSA